MFFSIDKNQESTLMLCRRNDEIHQRLRDIKGQVGTTGLPMLEPKRKQPPPEGQDRRSRSDHRSRYSTAASPAKLVPGSTNVPKAASIMGCSPGPFPFAIIFAIMGPTPTYCVEFVSSPDVAKELLTIFIASEDQLQSLIPVKILFLYIYFCSLFSCCKWQSCNSGRLMALLIQSRALLEPSF